MKIFLENVEQLSLGIWRVFMKPSEVKLLGNSPANYGNISVLMIKRSIYKKEEKSLHFDVSDALTLNVGMSDSTLIISDGKDVEDNKTGEIQKAVSYNNAGYKFMGDKKFLNDVSRRCPELIPIAEKLFLEIRRNFKGELMKAESGKFIETPDNFWTIILQPRDKSFRFTIRGIPEKFTDYHNIKLNPDRKGYSTFKLNNESLINDVISIFRQVSKKV